MNQKTKKIVLIGMLSAVSFVVMLVGRLPISALPLLVLQIFVGGAAYVALSILFKNESFFYLLRYVKPFLKRKS